MKLERDGIGIVLKDADRSCRAEGHGQGAKLIGVARGVDRTVRATYGGLTAASVGRPQQANVVEWFNSARGGFGVEVGDEGEFGSGLHFGQILGHRVGGQAELIRCAQVRAHVATALAAPAILSAHRW